MEILKTETLYVARVKERPILSLHARQFFRNGHAGSYYMVSRGDDPVPHPHKRPDAVVIVAFYSYPEQPTKLVLTSEYRIPIGCREISFPAGLIDETDYVEGETIRAAACRAAVREMKEETGLDFTPTEVSPDNLYSSAGMTNESVCYVIGHATGSPTTAGNEATEDIRVMLCNRSDVIRIVDNKQEEAISKTAWLFLWSFKYNGFPM